MTNTLSGVKTFTKAIIDSDPWLKDPLVVRKEWSQQEYELVDHGGGKNLCFAIMWDNEVVRPHPPLHRAMQITKDALEAAGHKVIDWVPHRHMEIYKCAQTILNADGAHDYMIDCAASGEPLIATMSPEIDPHPTTLEQTLIKKLVGPPKHHSAWELWQLHKEKRELRKSYLDHWQATVSETGTGRPVDAIISPAVAYTAVPHGLNSDSFYTTLGNAMDYSCAMFPVTYVDAELDQPHPPHEFHNHEDEAIYKLYTPELFPGTPVGLQLIGRTLEEEAVIGMTEIVDNALKKFKGE